MIRYFKELLATLKKIEQHLAYVKDHIIRDKYKAASGKGWNIK